MEAIVNFDFHLKSIPASYQEQNPSSDSNLEAYIVTVSIIVTKKLKFKSIDSSTDMIIATSGYPIVYNQIISSSTALYSPVSFSKSFKDPT